MTVRKEHPRRGSRRNERYGFFLLVMVILLADGTGCSYLQRTPKNGKVSVQAVSWMRVKKLAEPNAGLSGHKVTILNPADRNVIAREPPITRALSSSRYPREPTPYSARAMNRRVCKSKPDKR